MKNVLLFVFFSLITTIAFSQTVILKGKVTDKDNLPLVGAHIKLVEANLMTVTSEDGSFLIEKITPGDYILTISHIGYQIIEKKITLTGQNTFIENITLEMLEGRLREVVVSAERRNIEVRRLPEVHGTYIMAGKKNEVISVADLNANLAEKTGRQIFAKIPGVFVYDMDGSGNQVNISTRGLDPHRSWEYNVRQNGIMTNSDIYGYPASHYSAPMEAVQRVEMVRGTAALQYGAQFGGMINYVIKQPDTTKRIGFESVNTAGSFGLMSTFNALGGKIGKWSYYAYYQRRVSDGYRDGAESDSEGQYAMIQYTPNDKISLRAELGRSTYLFRIPGALTDSMFYENPRQATRQRNYFNPDIYIPAITLDWKIGEQTHLNFVSSAVLGSRNSVQLIGFANTPDIIDPLTGTYKNRQVDIDNFNSYTSELRLTHNYRLGSLANTVSSGVRYINNNLHRRQVGKGTTGIDFDLSITGDWGRDLNYKTQNVAFFIENMLYITPKWSIIPGFRIESGTTKMTGAINYYKPNNLPLEIEHVFPLFGVNTQYKINDNNRFYAGWSQAYRPVLFSDVIPPTALDVTDPDLKDAFGHNAEAGISGSILRNALHYDVSIFEIQYNNRIGSLLLTDDAGQSYVYKTNTGSSRTRGVEAYLEARLLNLLGIYSEHINISIFTATSYFDAYYTKGNAVVSGENRDLTDNRLETVPRWMTRNGLQCWTGAFSAMLQYSYVDESYSDALNTVKPTANGGAGLVPAYGIWDFNAGIRFAKHYTLKCSVNNFLDKQYFTKRPAGYPGVGVWGSDGRSFALTLGVKL